MPNGNHLRRYFEDPLRPYQRPPNLRPETTDARRFDAPARSSNGMAKGASGENHVEQRRTQRYVDECVYYFRRAVDGLYVPQLLPAEPRSRSVG
jgi:hypothetical protein